MLTMIRNLENLENFGSKVRLNMNSETLKAFGAKYASSVERDEEEEKVFVEMLKKMAEVEAYFETQMEIVRDVKEDLENQEA